MDDGSSNNNRRFKAIGDKEIYQNSVIKLELFKDFAVLYKNYITVVFMCFLFSFYIFFNLSIGNRAPTVKTKSTFFVCILDPVGE